MTNNELYGSERYWIVEISLRIRSAIESGYHGQRTGRPSAKTKKHKSDAAIAAAKKAPLWV